MGKISKREIKQNLESIPMDTLLLGTKGKGKLTHKQKEFAKGVAKGLTQSDAYRQAYDTEGKPSIVNCEASKLANNPKIAQVIEAYSQANLAKTYHSPLRLRELVIHQLTIHALSEEVPPAQRIKSLELLGKLTEVGAFTERKESVVIHESSKIKERLLNQLKTIIQGDITEVKDEGDELLAKIAGYRPSDGDISDPTTPPPPALDNDHPDHPIHTIPLTQSDSDSTVLENSTTVVENSTKEGVGGFKDSGDGEDVDYREVPPSKNGSPGEE
jgi:hypothetical protein